MKVLGLKMSIENYFKILEFDDDFNDFKVYLGFKVT